MTLAVVVKGSEGLVLAAESRLTLTVPRGKDVDRVTYDNATKVLEFAAPHHHVATVTFGRGTVDGVRTVASLMPEFEAGLAPERLPVMAMAEEILQFFGSRLERDPTNGAPMSFMVAGFDEGQAYGRVLQIDLGRTVTPLEYLPGEDFGPEWRGQVAIVDRLFRGFDPRLPELVGRHLDLDPRGMKDLRAAVEILDLPIPWQAISLQDCVDLALLGISATIECQALWAAPRECGGPIDVAVITRGAGIRFLRRKHLQADRRAR
jgi:hypothetical protein